MFRQAHSQLIDRVGFFEHCRAGNEARLHAIGDCSTGRIEDSKLWQ